MVFSLKAKHYYHIWMCAHFAPEKYLITEFMHVYLLALFFARKLLSCGCDAGARFAGKIW